jgi:hypothetical protein
MTTPEFRALLAEHRAADKALAALEAGGKCTGDAYEKARDRFATAHEAVLAARPSDPGDMAAQLRFLADLSSAGEDLRDRAVLEHIAKHLEEMGRAKS